MDLECLWVENVFCLILDKTAVDHKVLDLISVGGGGKKIWWSFFEDLMCHKFFDLWNLENISYIDCFVLTDGTGYPTQMVATRLVQHIQPFITKRQTLCLCLVAII